MRRREFLAGLGSAAMLPLPLRAQQTPVPVIGGLAAPAEATYTHHIEAIREGLKETGFIDGRNVRLEFRWADGQYDRLGGLAADLIRQKVNVIITLGGSPPILAVRSLTSSIPIIFHTGADPVRLGFVASLNRPGGNITGVTLMTNSMEPKRWELLHKMVPNAQSIAVLANPANPQNEVQLGQLREVARTSRMNLVTIRASNPKELEASFAGIAEHKADGLIVLSDVFFTTNSPLIAALSARHRVPTIAHSREFAIAGGLMSYGTNLTEAYRWTGLYAGRILKGEKPAELPVIEPTRFDFLINLKAAKNLGITVPPVLLATADEVIE